MFPVGGLARKRQRLSDVKNKGTLHLAGWSWCASRHTSYSTTDWNGEQVRFVVAYDIASDARRKVVGEALSAYGPRVQLSVFEVVLAASELSALVLRLEDLIDLQQDQVRMYPVQVDATVIGARTLEERASYWIVAPPPPDG